jgi:hypothetical protein
MLKNIQRVKTHRHRYKNGDGEREMRIKKGREMMR